MLTFRLVIMYFLSAISIKIFRSLNSKNLFSPVSQVFRRSLYKDCKPCKRSTLFMVVESYTFHSALLILISAENICSLCTPSQTPHGEAMPTIQTQRRQPTSGQPATPSSLYGVNLQQRHPHTQAEGHGKHQNFKAPMYKLVNEIFHEHFVPSG